jgi:hypothetical protein
MSIKQTLTDQMKTAMKAGEQAQLTTLRLLLSEIRNFEIDHGEQDDAGVQVIVGKMIKQWRDALNDYKRGGRADLAQEAHERIQLLQEFMPEQASETEIRQAIQKIIDNTPTPSLGPVTGQVMKQFAGKTDGATVSQLVREMLGKIPE